MKVIQYKVINTKAEEFFVNLRRRVNWVRKFIPVSFRNKFPSVGRFIPDSSQYPKGDCYFLTRDNTRFRIDRSDYVQWRLFYGVRDNALLNAKKYLVPGSMVLDIGASFGAFSLKLASYIIENKHEGIQVHAFEPNAAVMENYQYNLSLNPALAGIIHFHSFGLGNEKGEQAFQFEAINTGAGRVIQGKTHGQGSIKIERLDDFMEKIAPAKVAFIKLIVEGFEPEVFKGGWQTICEHRPPIFFEVTPSWWKENNSTVEEVLGKLSALGYRFMIEQYNEMLPYEPLKYKFRSQFNLMAVVVR